KSQTLTLSGYNGIPVTKITLSMKSNSGRGAGKLSYSTDGGSTFTYLVGSASAGSNFDTGWYSAYSTNYVDVEKTVDITGTTSALVIKIEATANSLYCQSYTLTYGSATPATPHTVTFDKGTGTCDTESLTETAGGAGVTLPAATHAIAGWSLHGWSTASVAATTAAPETVGTAGDTYYPEEDITLYAVYKKTSGSAAITASLTTAEIAAAKTKHSYGSSYVNNIVIESEGGNWGGYAIVNSNNLQINKNNSGYHLASPEYNGTVKSVHIYTTSNSPSNRTFYICSDNSTKTPTSGDLGKATSTQQGEDVEITLTDEASKFYIYSSGAVYIEKIEVTYGGPTTTYNSNPAAAGVGRTVTFEAGSGYCETDSLTETEGGMGVTLPTATIGIAGYDTFVGWAAAAVEGATEAPAVVGEAGDAYVPAADVTLYAVYRKTEGSAATPFTKITSTSDVNTDDEYLIVLEGVKRATNSDLASQKWQTSSITFEEDDSILSAGDATIIKFGKNASNFSIEMQTTEAAKYVIMSSSDLATSTTAQYKWSPETYNDGVILVEQSTGNSRYIGKVNSETNHYVKAYGSANKSTNIPAVLYKRTPSTLAYAYDTYVKATVTTNAYGYASFAPSHHLLMPENADLLYINGVDREKCELTLTSAKTEVGDLTLTAATGVLVKTDEPSTPVNLVYRDEKRTDHIVALTGNLLEGVTEPTPFDPDLHKYAYFLKGENFNRWKSGTLAANKCYLNLTEEQASSVSAFVLNFGGGMTTAIGAVEAAESADAPAYDLTGRRTTATHRGIIIRNGKKIIR
ncbi:MAG: InlB B-repeat-containing protein, partial [Bacteroidaceae bacterium]|nr:InlB B-repeat-containing protein [Bacteroidaceae bacterium]